MWLENHWGTPQCHQHPGAQSEAQEQTGLCPKTPGPPGDDDQANPGPTGLPLCEWEVEDGFSLPPIRFFSLSVEIGLRDTRPQLPFSCTSFWLLLWSCSLSVPFSALGVSPADHRKRGNLSGPTFSSPSGAEEAKGCWGASRAAPRAWAPWIECGILPRGRLGSTGAAGPVGEDGTAGQYGSHRPASQEAGGAGPSRIVRAGGPASPVNKQGRSVPPAPGDLAQGPRSAWLERGISGLLPPYHPKP